MRLWAAAICLLCLIPVGGYDALSAGGGSGLASSSSIGVQFFGDATLLRPPTSLAALGIVASTCVADYHACALIKPTATAPAPPVPTCWTALGAVIDLSAGLTASAPPASALACGGRITCILDTAGTLTCWRHGGTIVLQVPIGVAGQVAVGGSHICWVTSPSQQVDCIATEDGGQGAADLPWAVLNAGPRADTRLTLGARHGCVWGNYTSGTRYQACWGANGAGQAAIPPGAPFFTSMSAGGQHTCGLAGGSVSCWGSAERGATAVPSEATDRAVVAVTSGARGSCALKTDGTFVCWGESMGPGAGRAPGGAVAVTTSATAGAPVAVSGPVIVATGAVVSADPNAPVTAQQASGGVAIATGAGSVAGASSGALDVSTGAAGVSAAALPPPTAGGSVAASGPVLIATGRASGEGSSGSVLIGGGNAPGGGGHVVVATGAGAAASGALSLLPGVGGRVVAVASAGGAVAVLAKSTTASTAPSPEPAVVASDAGVYLGSAAAPVRRARFATRNVLASTTSTPDKPQSLALDFDGSLNSTVAYTLYSTLPVTTGIANAGGPSLAVQLANGVEGATAIVTNVCAFAVKLLYPSGPNASSVTTVLLDPNHGLIFVAGRCASGSNCTLYTDAL